MGEESASVNLIAEDGSEEEEEDETREEDEDEGWWVGTVGVVEAPDWAEEASCGDPNPRQTRYADHDEAEGGGQVEYEDECSAGELAEDEWWDLEPASSGLEGGRASASQHEAPQHLPSGVARPPRPVGAGQRELKKRPKGVADQSWEEARRNAWLRQMLSDTTSDEDEDEERYGRFAESGKWMTELYGLPQHLTPTSGGECSA
jgi:hypothetical protein